MKLNPRYLIWAALILLIVPLIYFAIINRTSDDNPSNACDIVVGFYMCGEGFGDSIVDEDISDTLGLSSDRFRFYYLVDYDGMGNTVFFTGDNYTRSYINISDMMPYDSTELDLGSREVLRSFTRFLFDIDARNHYLVIWGHGKGNEGVCFDHGSALSPSDIAYALNPFDLDLLIFDSCEMLSVEVLYEIRDSARYIMGSEKDIPDRGLDYAGGFVEYLKGSVPGPVKTATCIMDSTKDYYLNNPSRFTLQLSLIDTQKLDEFFEEIKDVTLDISVLPDTFESGKRCDLGNLLQSNGYEYLKQKLDQAVLYSLVLHSIEGILLQDVSGIAILDPGPGDDIHLLSALSTNSSIVQV